MQLAARCLKMPEMGSKIEETLPSVPKQSCSAHLKLLHSSSSSSAVEVVRHDQDEPGDVNLLLSPLTLAFAGGNTFHCRQIQRCYFQPRRRVSGAARATSVQHVKAADTKFGHKRARFGNNRHGQKRWEKD